MTGTKSLFSRNPISPLEPSIPDDPMNLKAQVKEIKGRLGDVLKRSIIAKASALSMNSQLDKVYEQGSNLSLLKSIGKPLNDRERAQTV